MSPIRTTTAPLACLASRPVSRLRRLPPIVRSTVTGFLVASDVVDMNSTYFGRSGSRHGRSVAAWTGPEAGQGAKVRSDYPGDPRKEEAALEPRRTDRPAWK